MIAVCVKEVPDATAARRIDPATRRLDRSGERTLNPFDAHAVEEALRLKEGPAGADTEVVVLCMGPETAMRTLGKALSLGAYRAVLISDDALPGADIWLTARRVPRLLVRETGAVRSRRWDSNPRPTDYKSVALPAELLRRAPNGTRGS